MGDNRIILNSTALFITVYSVGMLTNDHPKVAWWETCGPSSWNDASGNNSSIEIENMHFMGVLCSRLFVLSESRISLPNLIIKC